MKFWALLSFVTVLGLSACGPKSDRGSTSEDRPDSHPAPKLKPALSWGDLKCQNSKSCANSVLNLPLDQLQQFFSQNFIRPIAGANDEERSILCGRKTAKLWPAMTSMNQDDSNVDDFLFQVLDITQCVVRTDFSVRLKTYFENTKEYKNESL